MVGESLCSAVSTLLDTHFPAVFLIMQCSASSRSVTEVRLFDLFLLMRLKMCATARVAVDQDENLHKRSARLTCSVVLVVSAKALLTSGSPIVNSGISSSGSFISLFHKNLGPVSQVDDRSSLVVKPREAWLAGFSLGGMYLHW